MLPSPFWLREGLEVRPTSVFFLKLALRNAFAPPAQRPDTARVVIALVGMRIDANRGRGLERGRRDGLGHARRHAQRHLADVSLRCITEIVSGRRPAVRRVAVSNWFGGFWRDESRFFAKFAVDADNFFPISRSHLQADEFRASARPAGRVVGPSLADGVR